MSYHHIYTHQYFWRTHAQQEIDYIEERNGKIHAFDFKWNPKANKKFSKSFINAYHPVTTLTVSKNNFEAFLEME